MIKALLNKLRQLAVIAGLLFSLSTLAQVELAGWDFNGLSGFGTSPMPISSGNANISVGGLTRGIGITTVGTAAANAWGGNECNENNPVQADLDGDFISFTVKAGIGYKLSLSSINAYALLRTNNGANRIQWQYKVDNGTYVDIGSTLNFNSTGSNAMSAINLSGITALQNLTATSIITFRALLWGESGTSQAVYLNNHKSGNDLSISGTLTVNSDPYLNTDILDIAGFTYSVTEGGPSEVKSFQLIGENLNGTDVIISAPANYEISLNNTSGFAPTLNLPNTGSINTIIYARLVSGLSLGTFYSPLTINGGGVSTASTVYLDGVVVPCIYLWEENFDSYAQSTQNTPKWTTSYTEGDDVSNLQTFGKSFWGVYNQKFLINDIEGSGVCGLNNSFITQTIDVADYQNIKVRFSVSVKGQLEGLYSGASEINEGLNLTEGTHGTVNCATTDKLFGYYSLDGGSTWVKFASLHGGVNNNTYELESSVVTIAADTDLKVKIEGGTNDDAEEYYIDNLIISGSKNIIRPTTICKNTVVNLTCLPVGGTWVSSNPTCASISSTGVLTVTNFGTTTITYTTCNGTSSTTVNVTDQIPVISASGASLCSSGSTSITASADLSGTVFYWYDAATAGTNLFTGNPFITPTLSSTTNYYVEGNKNGCISARENVIVSVGPKSTTWLGTTDNEWTTESNWSNGVPCSSSKVIIPDVSTVSYYPIIQATTTCDTIQFLSGGAVKGLQYLEYNKAFIDLTLRRNQWYTLTSPLKELYSGDYYFEGTPISYIRLFDDIDPDLGEMAIGTWTKTFASLSVPLSTGYGFAFKIDSLEWNRTGANPIKESNQTDFNFSFPKTNTDGSLKRTTIPYSGINGKLNNYKTTTLTKDSAIAYRFAMEDASNHLPASIPVMVKPGLNLIGNPLMTHLDFNAFQLSNDGKIDNKVKFWNGSSFDAYLLYEGVALSTSLGSDPNIIIAPMQGFFIECITTVATEIDFEVANHFVADNTTSLRTCNVPKNIMHIQAETAVAKTSICIAKNETANNNFGKDDDYKLFSSLNDVPEVYTISSGKALGINQFKTYPYTTPLSIKCSKPGIVKLSFHGVGNFDEEAVVELINSRTGERIDLKENDQYNFEYDGANGSGELFLSFRTATVATDITENTDDDIQIYADGNDIHIISSPEDPIQDIDIWNPAGCQLVNKSNVNSSSFNTSMSSCSQYYIVKVTSNNKCKTTKVLVK